MISGVIERASFASLNQEMLANYIELLKKGKTRLAAISDDEIYELMSIKRNNEITLSAVMNFSLYPQAYFPAIMYNCNGRSGNRNRYGCNAGRKISG